MHLLCGLVELSVLCTPLYVRARARVRARRCMQLANRPQHFFHSANQCNEKEQGERDETLAVVLWKNAYDWIFSMMKNPYHMPMHYRNAPKVLPCRHTHTHTIIVCGYHELYCVM